MARKRKSVLKYYAIKTKAGRERQLVVDILKYYLCGDVPEVYESNQVIQKLMAEDDKSGGQKTLDRFGNDEKTKICLVEDVIDTKGYVIVGVKDRNSAWELVKRTKKNARQLLDWRVSERQVAFLKGSKIEKINVNVEEGDVVIPKTGIYEGELTKVVGKRDGKLIIQVIGSRIPLKIEINEQDVIAE